MQSYPVIQLSLTSLPKRHMNLITLIFNPFAENTYLLIGSNKQAVVIDPGMSNAAEEAQFLAMLTAHGATPVAIWLTHSHIDHVLGLSFLLNQYPSISFGHSESDRPNLKSNEVVGPMYGYHNFSLPALDREILLEEGKALEFDGNVFQILDVSGHSQGHLVFYSAEQNLAIVGDTLFQDSVGRYDLPGGNQMQLFENIRSKLLALSADTVIYPGHGPSTTIGREKKFNPFFKHLHT